MKISPNYLAHRNAGAVAHSVAGANSRQPQQLRVLSLAEVVRETMMLLRATLPAGITLETTIADDLPPIVADSTQMHQVVMNLCTNAWHALRQDGDARGRIAISLSVHDGAQTPPPGLRAEIAPGLLVCLTVSDNGVGMDSATLARAFEPFFTTRATDQGTGLGLSVVHGIVAAHHGAIAIDSLPGQGTTLRIYLPASSKTLVEAPAPPRSETMPLTDARHVLYIDDEAPLVMLAREMLETDGLTVTGHVDADAALAELREDPSRFDLVVTDFNMPKRSGLELARAVAALRPDLPVIIASGYITPQLQLEAAACGVRHLLHKPDIAIRLRQVVSELLSVQT